MGSVPADATKQDLLDHLNKKMDDAGLSTAPGDPVISCTFLKKDAFAKLRSVQETTDCLSRYLFLSQADLEFEKSKLKIKRPNKNVVSETDAS